MNLELKGKNIIVTGGTRGIGFAAAMACDVTGCWPASGVAFQAKIGGIGT